MTINAYAAQMVQPNLDTDALALQADGETAVLISRDGPMQQHRIRFTVHPHRSQGVDVRKVDPAVKSQTLSFLGWRQAFNNRTKLHAVEELVDRTPVPAGGCDRIAVRRVLWIVSE